MPVGSASSVTVPVVVVVVEDHAQVVGVPVGHDLGPGGVDVEVAVPGTVAALAHAATSDATRWTKSALRANTSGASSSMVATW